MTDDGTGLMTIGALARTTGITVRTIRYWSDEGALPPVTRSAGSYRLYDAACVARLELIRTLRELGLGLDAVRRVMAGETTVSQVAAAHVSALDAQIDSLRVTRAVLSTVARRGSTAEEMTLIPTSGPTCARWPSSTPPTARPVRRKGRRCGSPSASCSWRGRRWSGASRPSRRRPVPWLRELVGDGDRAAVLERLRASFGGRVGRYRELLATVRGSGPLPAHREEFAWVVAALEARAGS